MPEIASSCRLLALVAGLLACPALPAAAAPLQDNGALYSYVRGRVAAGQGQIPEAAQSLSLAARTPDPALTQRRFELALLAGDQRMATRLALELDPKALDPVEGSRFGSTRALVGLTRATALALGGDWAGYGRQVKALAAPEGASPPLVITLLDAWGRAGRGDVDGALALLDPAESNAMFRSYFQEHRAHILAMARRWPEAADAYAGLVAGEGANVPRLRVQAAGALLEAGRARPAEAASYRERAIAILGGGAPADPLLADARARIAASPRLDGRALPGQVTSATDGLAQLFLRLSVEAQRERGLPVAVPFARLATFLAPTLPETWLVAGDALSRQQLWDMALAAFARVPPGPYARTAEARAAQVLAAAGDTGAARVRLQALASSPGAVAADWVRLSDLEREAGDHAAAARALDRAIALLPKDSGADTAYMWFLRGSAHEQAGNWSAAEADLRRAVDLAPDNPVFLNYLGYSLLDRGKSLDEADALIARAFRAAPDNGAIIDSMGWSAYVRGDYARAVELLEQARAAEPADPTVADHLGDALWRAGRRIEARHAWASALTLEPSDSLAEQLRRKLDYGLDIALARR